MKYTNYQEPLFLSVFALFITTLFSTCSFLYPLNPWDDANVYMTIGNAMLTLCTKWRLCYRVAAS